MTGNIVQGFRAIFKEKKSLQMMYVYVYICIRFIVRTFIHMIESNPVGHAVVFRYVLFHPQPHTTPKASILNLYSQRSS